MAVMQIIKRIYELSWDMFGDLPRGHHKNNSMHKVGGAPCQGLNQQKVFLGVGGILNNKGRQD
jgi:hypothetical protein